MIKAKIILFTVCMVLLLNNTFCQDFSFKDKDRVCFIGNSITMNGLFHNYIELYYVTRFPDKEIKFYNCGISGDVSGGILKRMDSDVLIHKPTWSVLMVGMNDVGRSLYDKDRINEPGIKDKQQEALRKYMKNVDSIIRILLHANTKVVLQTPSIYDQTADITSKNYYGVNDALKVCADYLKESAKKYNLPVVDYWTLMSVINEKVQKTNSSATIIGNDRVHPGREGHFLMAAEFLKAQHVPEYVSYISINAKIKTIDKSVYTKLTELKWSSSSVLFSSHASSLPFPLLSDNFNPDSLISFTNNFNKEVLQVKSLKKGSYLLHIDSVLIGTYSETEFNSGINLSNNRKTAQYQQAEKVLELLNQYWALERKLRQIKYVEYQLLGNTNLPKTFGDSTKKLFEQKLETYKDQPRDYVAYYKKNFEDYLINKPVEEDLQRSADDIFNEIQRQNKPIKHNYRIHKIN